MISWCIWINILYKFIEAVWNADRGVAGKTGRACIRRAGVGRNVDVDIAHRLFHVLHHQHTQALNLHIFDGRQKPRNAH